MRRTSIIAAAIGGLLVSSSAFAGFAVTAVKSTSGAFDVWTIQAINDGAVTTPANPTGTQVKGLEYFYEGSPVTFEVTDADENGVNDTVNLTSTTRTRIRVATSTNTYVGLQPAGLGVEPNPYDTPLTAFQGAIANTGTTQASGTGFQIARLFLPTGGSGVFSGNLGGDIGTKVPFSVTLGTTTPPLTNNPVIVNNNASTNAVFGQIVTNGAPFSIQINATDVDPGDVLALAVGALPAGVSNISVSPATSGSPATFTVTGLVDYSLNGTTVNVPFNVNATSGTAAGQFSVVVTPEPTSLAALGLSSLFLGRRRK